MKREHRTTHPVLGPATWRQMREAARKLREESGVRICTWCHTPVPARKRTRCGSAQCAEFLWRAWSWDRCRKSALRATPRCGCGKRAREVDHIVPVSLGGSGDQWNLRCLCRACHLAETGRLRREREAYVAEARRRINDSLPQQGMVVNRHDANHAGLGTHDPIAVPFSGNLAGVAELPAPDVAM
jgi:5-methylcytosine-specific restriction endonuclease McrA